MIKHLLSLVMILFYLSSCSSNFNEDELINLKIGETKDEMLSTVGEPTEIQNTNRLTYDSNKIVYTYKGKVIDFFSKNDIIKSKSDSHANISDSSINSQIDILFKKVKIGMTNDEIIEILGKANVVERVEVVSYGIHKRVVLLDGKIDAINLHYAEGLEVLDKVRLNFSGGSMLIINIALAIIMFGVAIDIEVDNFKEVLKHPKSLLVGALSQFLALPALTFGLILIIQPTPSVAMGMILVAASPGGNISNFMTSLAKGNSALSVSLTAVATISAVFMTPLNFSFWGNMYSKTSNLIVPIEIDAMQMIKTVLILLGIPIVLGLLFRKYYPDLTKKIAKPLRIFSIIFFLGLIVGAMSLNFEFIVKYIYLVVGMVFAHNLLALFTGYSLARIFKLPEIDRRTLSIETGIQNSGLALVLIFNPKLFNGLGGMAFIAAWWAIWHIVSGLVVAFAWRKIKI